MVQSSLDLLSGRRSLKELSPTDTDTPPPPPCISNRHSHVSVWIARKCVTSSDNVGSSTTVSQVFLAFLSAYHL